MRNVSKLLTFGAALACSLLSARADQLSISGHDTFTSGTITAIGPYTTTASGQLFGAVNGGTVAFAPVAIIYTTPSYPAFPVFTVTSGADILTFFSVGGTYTLTSYQDSTNSGTDLALAIDANGFFTSNYFAGELPGTLTINTDGEPSPGGSTSNVVAFNATATAPTPEPASLMLLGSGAAGAAGLVRRRRSLQVTN